jgi:Fur family peroxide stress response transcriptional regulator
MTNEHQHDTETHNRLNQKLGESGLRATKQRELVYDLLLGQRDHPTADEVFARAKADMPSISLATVYNCLETLVQCDLVKQVNFEREPTRYCPNQKEHAHFHDLNSGRIFDIDLDNEALNALRKALPRGFEASSVNITFRGMAPR